MTRTILRLFSQGLRDLALNPWAQLLTLAAVTLVAFMAGMFMMALTTINYQLGTVRGETSFQVYWQPGTPLKLISEQSEEFKHLPGFNGMKFFTPDEALKELDKRLGRGGTLKEFPFMAENNPLPATALLSFAPKDDDVEGWIKQIGNYLNKLPQVSRVVATPLRDELGQAWRKANSYIMRPVIVFLALVLGLVVGNMVRLSMLSRSAEIEILKLVGAYPWYIRMPLMVGGAVQGLLGGCLALLMLRFIHLQIRDALNFPPLLLEIQFLPWQLCALLIFIPAGMGMLASWLAVRDSR